MQLLILYSLNNETTRVVEEFVSELEARTDKQITLIDKDSKDGIYKSETYGILEFPALLVVTDEGSVVHMWHGSFLPTVSEVLGYLEI
jgi:hypothetical protein